MVQHWLKGRLGIAETLMARIPLIGHSQHELMLLRFCGSTKMLHLAGMIAPGHFEHTATANDTAMRSCLSAIMGGDLTDDQWLQACLPARFSGVGINNPLHTSQAAYTASANKCASLLDKCADDGFTRTPWFVC